jgi:hypothetical protein
MFESTPNLPPTMSESTSTPVSVPEFVYTIDYHSAPCHEIKVEFDREVSYSTARYQGTVPTDLLPQALARSILHQVVAALLEYAVLERGGLAQKAKTIVINRFWFKRDGGSVVDMADMVEAEVQGDPGKKSNKLEMQVRGHAVAELKKFFEEL